MILKLLRQLNRAYGYAVFGIYLAAFGIAFLFVFIFPPATLALLFISIFGLLFFNVLGFVLRTIEKRWNRARLGKGSAPSAARPPCQRSRRARERSAAARAMPGTMPRARGSSRSSRSLSPCRPDHARSGRRILAVLDARDLGEAAFMATALERRGHPHIDDALGQDRPDQVG